MSMRWSDYIAGISLLCAVVPTTECRAVEPTHRREIHLAAAEAGAGAALAVHCTASDEPEGRVQLQGYSILPQPSLSQRPVQPARSTPQRMTAPPAATLTETCEHLAHAARHLRLAGFDAEATRFEQQAFDLHHAWITQLEDKRRQLQQLECEIAALEEQLGWGDQFLVECVVTEVSLDELQNTSTWSSSCDAGVCTPCQSAGAVGASHCRACGDTMLRKLSAESWTALQAELAPLRGVEFNRVQIRVARGQSSAAPATWLTDSKAGGPAESAELRAEFPSTSSRRLHVTWSSRPAVDSNGTDSARLLQCDLEPGQTLVFLPHEGCAGERVQLIAATALRAPSSTVAMDVKLQPIPESPEGELATGRARPLPALRQVMQPNNPPR